MENKKIFSSLMTFGITALLFASVIFAWFTLREQAKVDEIVFNVNELRSQIDFYVSKNDDEFVVIDSHNTMLWMFSNSIPSDRFIFRLLITNESSRSSAIRIVLKNIKNNNANEGFDMRNVFFIKDGLVRINDDEKLIQLQPKIELLDPVHGQDLNLYNLNNLLVNGDITTVGNYQLNVDESIKVEFTLVYDEETNAMGYQEGIINFDGIYIYNN